MQKSSSLEKYTKYLYDSGRTCICCRPPKRGKRKEYVRRAKRKQQRIFKNEIENDR